MTFVKGQSGNPLGLGKSKPFRDALRIEAALAENGVESPAPRGSIRWVARQLLNRAGEETAALKELADRLDGKVPQGLIGGDEDDNPIRTVTTLEIVAPTLKADDNAKD